MKAHTTSKKAISATSIALLFLSQQLFAQKQGVESEYDNMSYNTTFMLCILFFIVGFTILIILKLRDDKKQREHRNPVIHARHRNHYGSRHQYIH